jgi:3-oxoacyl-[acyl-carrier protein] reductase
MLATLLYRVGATGCGAAEPERAMANGQCFLARRDLLERTGGYVCARASFADDVTLARSLARAGARVAINYLNGREAAEETLAAIKDAGGDAFLIQADVTDSNAVKAMLDEVGIAFSGRLDILVNLAGGMVARKTLGEMDEAFFDHVMTLNLKSAFLVLHGALPFLGEGSAVVNVSSLAGRDGGGPGASVYATAKGAMMTWTRSMAKELGPQGFASTPSAPD